MKDDIFASIARKKTGKEDALEQALDSSFEKGPEDALFVNKDLSSDEVKEIFNFQEEESKELEVKTEITEIADNTTISSDVTTVIDPVTERDIDYDFARKNLKEIIQTSKDALEGIKNVAEQTCHPRAYEVLALVANSIIEANRKLMDVHKQRQELELKEKDLHKKTGPVTNNNLFVGSTNDLLELVKKLNAPKKD